MSTCFRGNTYTLFGGPSRLVPRERDPLRDCPDCEGKSLVFDEAVNRRRHHFMRYRECETCKGTGRRSA